MAKTIELAQRGEASRLKKELRALTGAQKSNESQAEKLAELIAGTTAQLAIVDGAEETTADTKPAKKAKGKKAEAEVEAKPAKKAKGKKAAAAEAEVEAKPAKKAKGKKAPAEAAPVKGKKAKKAKAAKKSDDFDDFDDFDEEL